MFITIEGPEGSGKTSVMQVIVERLAKEGYPLIHTREPGGAPIAEEIRKIILNKSHTSLDARTEALLYAASRRQHLVETVWPALKENKIVFCDRYIDSSLAYQGGARHLGIDRVLKVNRFATEGFMPDLTLLFDVDPVIGLARINSNQNREINRLDLEKMSFHKIVRTTYLKLAAKYPGRIVVIDASKPLDEVIESTYAIIKKRLDNQ